MNMVGKLTRLKNSFSKEFLSVIRGSCIQSPAAVVTIGGQNVDDDARAARFSYLQTSGSLSVSLSIFSPASALVKFPFYACHENFLYLCIFPSLSHNVRKLVVYP